MDPAEHPVLLTESSPLTPKVNREKMTQIMFEKFNTPLMYTAVQAVLGLYASGTTEDLVLQSGDAVTYSMFVYDGHILKHTVNHLYLGGRDLTDYLHKMLQDSGHSFPTNSPSDHEIVRDMKEKLCYVALDYEKEKETATSDSNLEKSYCLPDDTEIKINCERFRCPEALLRPSLVGMDSPGIHKTIIPAILQSNLDDVHWRIVLCGGNTRFPGMAERLVKELKEEFLKEGFSASTKCTVRPRPDTDHLTWLGGSILASLSTFQQLCISKDEYEEFGPAIVHRKCF